MVIELDSLSEESGAEIEVEVEVEVGGLVEGGGVEGTTWVG